MSSKFLNLDGLKECLGSENPAKAKEIVENACKFFDQDLTSAELAHAIEVLFHDLNGALAFVNKSIRHNKLFNVSNVAIFELWSKLFSTYAKEINFDAYIENVSTVCLQYAVSTVVSAKEKECATIVMQELVQNGLIREMDVSPIVTKLLAIVMNQKIKQSTFLQEVYKLLGIIARNSPCSMTSVVDAESMRDVFLKPLEIVLLNEETLQFNTLTGALQGLNLYLMSFAPSPETEPDVCKRIYTCVKRLSDPMDSTKKATFRASIELFTTHTSLFGSLIFKDAQYWHTCLEKWLSSTIYEDRRRGIYAIHAFHQAIAAEILHRKDENDRNILGFFMNFFREKLESKDSPSYLFRIAVRGFGVMSGPCKVLLPEMLDKLTLLVIQRTELVSIAEDNELRDILEHFPDYVEALSQIITITDDKQVMEMLAHNVETITIRLIRDFHYLSRAYTQLVLGSLLKAFFNLSKVSGNLLDDILEKVIFQGMIFTCAHKLVYDAVLDWSTDIDWKENITFRAYFPLWEGLILDVENFTYNRPMIAEKIFNYIMKSLFAIVNKLDFRTKRRVYTDEDGTDKEFYFCDPNIDLCPVKPQDFHIFFNVVDFLRDLFWVKFRATYFRPWIQEFCTTMLRLAIQNPLVSGFLKLLEIGLVKAEFLHYFDDTMLLEVHNLRSHLSHFLKHLITKCQKISGELQISCLELILKYPIHFYNEYITALIPVFQIALDIGKSTLWLAKLAVGAIEKMHDQYSEDSPEMSKFFKRVLPCLDSYLRSKGFEEAKNPEIVRVRNKRRMYKAIAPKVSETELISLQKRIMAFIGKLTPQTATAMILDGKPLDNLVKWEMNQSLRVILHFPTMRPSIYLDTIMPRICELAVSSSDRKTKVSACELVHAVILYVMGIRRYKGQIWKELCRCMFILGSDSDGTVQQMFEPLLKQVMHYMSKYENFEGVESLMEALMNGISNSGNSSIRDLSAVCLREFIEWSIKQVRAEQLAVSEGSISIILEHLKMYSFDSDSAKRNGAALAFNNLYRILREQETICDVYFIDLFHTFCVNFKLSEEMSTISLAEDLNSDLEQVSMSLDHVVRVLKERNDIFNREQSNRIVPSVKEIKTLKDIVLFLVTECSSKLMNYRRKCIEISRVLSVRVLNINSYAEFLKKHTSIGLLQDICEGPMDGTGIKARPNLDFLKNEKSFPYSLIYSWLQHFLSSLDCYCLLLDVNSVEGCNEIFDGAKIFEVISYYLDNICWEGVAEILNRINPNSSISSADTIVQMNSEDCSRIETIKTIITIRIMDFMCKAHVAGCADAFPSSYWAENKHLIIKFLNQMIFEVHKLNFDFRVQNIRRKLPKYIEVLMEILHEKCADKQFVIELQQDILENLKARLNDIHTTIEEILSSDSVSEEQQNSVAGIKFVCQHLEVFHADASARKFLKNMSMEIFSDLFLKIKKTVLQNAFAVELDPSVEKLVNELMSVCFIVNTMAPNVVHCLLDTTELKAQKSGTMITHGSHFLKVYKNTVFKYSDERFIQDVISQLLRNITSSNFHQILNFFIDLIGHLDKNRKDDTSSLKAAIDHILENIANIIQVVNKNNEQQTFTKLVSNLLNASPYEVQRFRKKAPSLEEWILDQLRNETLSLKRKSNIIYLLPALVGPDDQEHCELTEALEGIQRQYLPLRSSEFAKNSYEETALKYVFKYLLNCLVFSKSYVILEFLIKCTAPDSKHVIEWMIRSELKSYTLLLSVNQQTTQLNLVLKVISDREIEPKFRLTILDRFLLTMIQNCHTKGLEEFFIASIKRIYEMIETNYGSGNSGWIVEHSLVDRIIGFSLVEVMFGSLPKDNLLSRDSAIGRQLLGELKSGNELVGILTKKAFYSRTEVFVTDDPSAKELFRQYQCAAYRSVCSLVSNTQTGLQFYSKFIFEENSTKNELVWQKLIDCTNNTLYSFDSQEMEEYLKVKERFISIRKINPRPSSSGLLPTYSSRQLQTQSIFQSSLSQDVSKLDLNYSTVRTDAEVLAQMEKLEGTVASVHLERTVLNKHEVMPILCGVIEHMFENSIAPKPPPAPENRRPYKWITAIASAIENSENHKNIRLFLAQMVQNCREVFQHYSYALFSPVLQVLVDECAGTRLNFFTTDLIAMLLSWTSKNYYTPSTSEEKHLISQLLKFVMKNTWHEKREIFKFNLELIQSMINLWKDCIAVPSQLLLDAITRSQTPNSRENGGGIMLLGLLLNSGLDVWTSNTKQLFLRSIVMNLNNDLTIIYQSASSVLGMMLTKLQSEEDTDFAETQIPELVQRIKNTRAKNEKKFLDIVYGIHKHYPEIVDSFREIIIFKIPLALGAIKCMYLEMLLTRIEAYEGDDSYKILVSIGITSIVKSLDYQLLGLHIINRAVRKMKHEDVQTTLNIVEECTESRKADCRDVAYEILIYIALNFPTEMSNRAGQLLLNGLMDPDTKIQDRIFHFWSNETCLSSKIEERILFLISDYSVKCEKQFLGFCTQLLLELTIKSPESKRQVFEFQTDDDSKLMEYYISTEPQIKKTNSLPPLFAETHNTRRSLLLGSQSYNYVQNGGSNDYFFEPTLDPGKTRTLSQSFTLPTQSALPFIISSQTLDRNSQKVRAQEGTEAISLDKSFDRLRKRFLKDKEKETRYRVLQVIDRRVKQKTKMEIDLKKKESRVVLYRRYRNGDYPDLLINHLALLLPLQGLVRRDPVIAREVFVSIFATVLEALGPEANMFIISISSKIQGILENAKSCDPMIFATFLEIALLQPAKFDFAPEMIAMIAKATNMLTIGAIYLEHRINADWDTDLLSAKSSSTVPIDEQHWLHLSDIYNSLAEYDVVSSIFADKMRTDPRLAEAIELKANGKYEEAQQLLLEVIDRRVQVEHYYAYICYYECFLEMGMWSELSKNVQNQLDDFEELWTDDYNTAFLLPNLMQSELQLILQNKSQSNDFLRILESWTADPVKSEYMKRVFCEELMMLHIASRDFLQARVYGEAYLRAFQMDWAIISSMNNKLRLKNLLNAQKVAEIDHYGSLLIDNFSEASVAKLNSRWERCSIGDSESLRFWNCVLAYRSYIGYLIQDMLGNVNSEGLESTQLQDNLFKMHLQLFNTALKQGNYILSARVLEQLRSSPCCNRNLFNLQCEIATVKQVVLESHSSTASNQVQILKRAWLMSDNIIQNNEAFRDDTALHLEVLNLHSNIGEQILTLLSPDILRGELLSDLKDISGANTAQRIKQYIFDQSFQSTKKATEISESVVQKADLRSSVANSFYRFAQFCYDHRSNETNKDSVEMEGLVIKFVFLAMKYDSKEACQLFPSILQLQSVENQTLLSAFSDYSADVPEWMFLPWIPQILSHLDLNKSSHLDDIVRRIAHIYPNALIYPFNVWFERFTNEPSSKRHLRAEIQEIADILENPIADMFIRNLKILCLPEALLMTHIEQLLKSVTQRERPSQTVFRQKIDSLVHSVFVENQELQGRAYRSIQIHKQHLLNLKSLKIQADFETIQERLHKIRDNVKGAMQKVENHISLESICPWLAHYQWCGEESFLELPGQYEDDIRPKVFDHIKIMKFGQKIEVFGSLRRPFRITIYGSNAKSYDFLVKFGEDLKQDQRVQQLLRLMSSKLAEDQNCRNHNLFIRTFKVTPIGRTCGMMSWVLDTISLQTFFTKALLTRDPTGSALLGEMHAGHVQFLKDASREENRGARPALDIYGKAAQHYSRNQIAANFRNLENIINLEIIKLGLVDMSVSPDSFYVLRNNFATSMVATSISNWILGIGDRHILNILISTKDATLTGIDFGCTFGCGVRNLPVPELIPFRLTPHMVGTMNPMGTSGVISKCMGHALRVFRNSRRILMACMEVFVREPTINWVSSTRIGNIGGGSDSSDENWEPRDRIEVAEQKLLGYNPMHLMEKELRAGVIGRHPDYLEGYVKILRGDQQFNIRARLPEQNLTVEQQVKCLIDLATDPAVLGIAYEGFLPWL